MAYFPPQQIPSPNVPRNALVGIGNPWQQTNALQQGPMPYQQHPMMYQSPVGQYGGFGGGFMPPQRIPNPVQWPNPHQGAYQQWLQKNQPQQTNPTMAQRY